MQMVKKLLVGIVLVWAALILFMPKEELYFSLERELAKEGVEINEASIEEGLLTLTLKDVTVYVKGIEVATVKEITLVTLLVYTKVEAVDFHVDKEFYAFVPEYARKIVLTHTVADPDHIKVDAAGSFGVLEGKISLSKRTVHLDFAETKDIEAIQSQLKKGEEGWYYETAF